VEYAFHLSTPLVLAALIVDFVVGDPRWLPHPVRLIGRMITDGDRRLRSGSPASDLRNGFILAVQVIVVSAAVTWAAITLASAYAPWLGAALAVVLAWTTIATRDLDRAASKVETALASGREDEAKSALPALVGRDPDALDRDGIIKATVESVAENSSDGVVAPLFYLFIGGPVAAIAYKAINTLDSMLGHRDERYLFFGRAAARIDDIANFIPARLTALSFVLAADILRGRGARAFSVCWNDANRHPSVNAGYPEAAMAGALGIELGGDAIYEGESEPRPFLGSAEVPPDVDDIAAARRMMWLTAASAFGAFAIARIAMLLLQPVIGG
jgi:adenosylcobinamide-phosphate synthase